MQFDDPTYAYEKEHWSFYCYIHYLNEICYLFTKVPVFMLIRSTQGFQMLIFGPVTQKIEAIFLMIFPTQPSYLGTNTAQDHFTMILGIVVLCPAGLFENWRITGSNPVECWDFFFFFWPPLICKVVRSFLSCIFTFGLNKLQAVLPGAKEGISNTVLRVCISCSFSQPNALATECITQNLIHF